VFKNDYPAALAEKGILIQHYTQYLAQIIEEGRCGSKTPLNLAVTFQDPCYLGRHNQDYDSLRCILKAIPGSRIDRDGALWRGWPVLRGWRGRMWLETAVGNALPTCGCWPLAAGQRVGYRLSLLHRMSGR
jgi:hypothetical protein